MARIKALLFCLSFVLLFLPGYIEAANTPKESEPKVSTTLTDLIVKDSLSVQAVSGFLYSPVIENGGRPNVHYVQSNLRMIWMLDPESTSKKIGLRGNFDFVFELTTLFIVKGPGNVITGVTGLLRYDFAYQHGPLRYYAQAGAGIVYTDAHEDLSQSLIGNPIEYTPQFSVGVHYILNKNWSIDGEAMFHHISNAGINEDRNVGVNALRPSSA